MSPPRSLSELIHRGDLAGLVVEVDRLANLADWDGLFTLRSACLRAVEEVGKQLWGPAQYADYRIALDAPPARAASVVVPGAGRFALGPLTEVVAQHHTWDELADHLAPPVIAATVAQERVLRGEDLTGDARAHPDELGLPLVLQPWEPRYPLPVYRPDELNEAGPEPVTRWDEPMGDTRPGSPLERPDLTRALRELVATWVEQSTGEARVAVVEGDVRAAVSAVVVDRRPAPGLRRVALGRAFEHLVWAAASGGARGRRRGMAAGRASAFWLGHVLSRLPFPADPDELEFALEELDWVLFGGGDEPGWSLRLAVAQPGDWAAAIEAADHVGAPPERDPV